MVDRADKGPLLGAWVIAEARHRRQVAAVGASMSHAAAPTGGPQRAHRSPSFPVRPRKPARSAPPACTPPVAGARNFGLRSAVAAGQVVLEVDGEVDVATAPELEKELVRLVSGSDRPVIVNLRSTTFFDSRGLHAILAGIRAARDRGSDIVLQAPSPNVRKILEISGAVQLLDVVD